MNQVTFTTFSFLCRLAKRETFIFFTDNIFSIGKDNINFTDEQILFLSDDYVILKLPKESIQLEQLKKLDIECYLGSYSVGKDFVFVLIEYKRVKKEHYNAYGSCSYNLQYMNADDFKTAINEMFEIVFEELNLDFVDEVL